MADEQIADAVALAIQLEEKGQIKEAYFSFTLSSQKAITALNEIKFIHSSIISSPKQYSSLLSSIKTCLIHIENIIENHSPSTISRQTTGDKVAPPLPPKPSRMQKPLVPPKPSSQHELQDNSPDIRPHVPIQPPQHTDTPFTVRIVPEGQIDPDYLVPAQTHAGDSLAPSSSSTMNTDHIPLIPAPPLLTTHRLLSLKLDELDETIKLCRIRSKQEDGLDQMIAQYLEVRAELNANLNNVRTIYMSAATIPTVLQFQAHIIAYQITLIEAAIFDAIPPLALLEHSSKKPHPRIVASTDFFNYITRCIEHAVLLPQEGSSRAQLIHYWIKVASRCFDINNYQTLKAIISALNTPPVQRLKRTWAYIPKKSVIKLEALNDLMSEANNYGQYREHMGMVSTTVVHGKSVQLIRDEHDARPTVPFLGTFILDITYLLAAFKSSTTTGNPQEEPRIHQVLQTMRRFQTGPRYTPALPASFLKSSQKHYFRPAISNALHRGASRIQRISGGTIFGFDGGNASGNNSGNITSNNNSSTNLSIDDDEDGNLEEQQKMATQYILMRSWVSQNTVDELSTLREPQLKTIYNTARSNSSGPSANRTSSVFSNTSSSTNNNVRFSTGSVSLNTQSTASRPTSMEEEKGFFSSFRRSESGNLGARPVTIHEGLPIPKENLHAADRITWNGGHPMAVPPPVPIQAPLVPPRPLPKPSHDDEFKAALAQRLAKVAER